MPSVAEELKQIPLFSDLNQRESRRLAKHFKVRTIPAGVQLTRQGEMSGVAFFVIAEGTAAVIVDGEQVRAHGDGGSAHADALLHDPVLALPRLREEES